jgi:predicted regulator of Ras-like GTPase activity (Roadblock/LC7/MglB family)
MTSIEPQELSADVRDVNCLLDDFVRHTTGVKQAVAVSSDGLLMAASAALQRSDVDEVAAMVSGLTSLASSASQLLSRGSLHQVTAEFHNGYLLVLQISGGSCLGVITQSDCDLELVGYEANMLVRRIGALLTGSGPVIELKASLVL